MRDLRPFLIPLGVPAGLALGGLAWAFFIGGAPVAEQLTQGEARLSAIATPRPHMIGFAIDRTAQAAATPLFALTTGPGAVAEIAVRLDGVARSRDRVAALLSIDGKPSAWLRLGETRDGVTLTEVQTTKVVVDTPIGFKEVALGKAPDAGAASPAGGG